MARKFTVYGTFTGKRGRGRPRKVRPPEGEVPPEPEEEPQQLKRPTEQENSAAEGLLGLSDAGTYLISTNKLCEDNQCSEVI